MYVQYSRCFVTSFGWFEKERSLFIAMEYLKAGDLYHYLRARSSPLPEREARSVAIQIVEGLGFMHEQGFAHRDLKPPVRSEDASFSPQPRWRMNP